MPLRLQQMIKPRKTTTTITTDETKSCRTEDTFLGILHRWLQRLPGAHVGELSVEEGGHNVATQTGKRRTLWRHRSCMLRTLVSHTHTCSPWWRSDPLVYVQIQNCCFYTSSFIIHLYIWMHPFTSLIYCKLFYTTSHTQNRATIW